MHQRGPQGVGEGRGLADPPMLESEGARERLEIGRAHVGVMPTAAELGVLYVADHAVTFVVHHDDCDVEVLLNRRP